MDATVQSYTYVYTMHLSPEVLACGNTSNVAEHLEFAVPEVPGAVGLIPSKPKDVFRI